MQHGSRIIDITLKCIQSLSQHENLSGSSLLNSCWFGGENKGLIQTVTQWNNNLMHS